jgi:hypothetical protein
MSTENENSSNSSNNNKIRVYGLIDALIFITQSINLIAVKPMKRKRDIGNTNGCA